MPARALTRPPAHHFFGYYDKCPWDPFGRQVLAMEVEFMDRPPRPDDVARLGLVDPERGDFQPVAETTAWCWQQGTMLQWMGHGCPAGATRSPDAAALAQDEATNDGERPAPGDPRASDAAATRRIIYNVRRPGGFGSVVLDVDSGARRDLPRSVYALSRDGAAAVCVNHARLAVTRPGYGYVGHADPFQGEPHSAADGVWWLDLATGQERLVVSLEQAVGVRHRDEMDGARHWFNHLQFNPDDTRFLFLHRYGLADGGRRTRLFTCDPEGRDLRLVADDDMVSHFDWRDATHICAWARQHGRGDAYYLFDDLDVSAGAWPEAVGLGVLTTDGHCSFAHEGRWMLTDTYPDGDHMRTLLLWDMTRQRRVDLGRFYAPPQVTGEIRCDLHPRWSRDGTGVCFDSVHEGTRQMYVLDVSEAVAAG